MNKALLITTLALATAGVLSVDAKRISESQAAGMARQFATTNVAHFKKAPAVPKKAVYAPQSDGEPLLYVFNNGNGDGYTVISGDDQLPAVLGYSFTGDFDTENLNPNFRYWLESYQREISWYYRHGGRTRIIEQDNASSIGPLLSTQWNQDAPYNNLCPVDQTVPPSLIYRLCGHGHGAGAELP